MKVEEVEVDVKVNLEVNDAEGLASWIESLVRKSAVDIEGEIAAAYTREEDVRVRADLRAAEDRRGVLEERQDCEAARAGYRAHSAWVVCHSRRSLLAWRCMAVSMAVLAGCALWSVL